MDRSLKFMKTRHRQAAMSAAIVLSLLLVLLSCKSPASLNRQKILHSLKILKNTAQTVSQNKYRYAKNLDFPNVLDVKKNVVLISLDTLRADRLNGYGYKRRITSPAIDRLAAAGVLFESCIIHSPGTLSSQMSLLTGYYPTVHGITYRRSDELQKQLKKQNQPVSEDYYYRLPAISNRMYTLAEILKVHGYQTFGVHEGGYLSAPLGYACGFDRFICSQSYQTYGEEGKRKEGLAKTFAVAEEFLDSTPRQPFFMFFHTYEIHTPYIHETYALAENFKSQEGEYFSACYDGGILYTDRYVGELLSLLERKKLLDQTVIVLTSDHGEEFGDHYPIWYGGHGQSQYQEQIRVPLIILDPTSPKNEKERSNRRVADSVECVDIVPTILELVFGKEHAYALMDAPELKRNGRSLVPLFFPARRDQKTAYFEDSYFGPERIGMICGGYKLVIMPNPREIIAPDQWDRGITERLLRTPAKEMFFLVRDPDEKVNVIGENKDLAEKMEKAVLEIRRQLERQNEYFGGRVRTMDDAVLQQLKSLGYAK
jgi:arylsulfatase A-like enzyme